MQEIILTSHYLVIYSVPKLLFTTNIRLNNGIEFNIHFLFLNGLSFYKNLFKEDRDPYILVKYTQDATDTPTPPSSLFMHSNYLWSSFIVDDVSKREREGASIVQK